MNETLSTLSTIIFGEYPISIENILNVAKGKSKAELSDDKSFLNKIDQGVKFLNELLEEDGVIYGVTTGYGDSCEVDIPPELVEQLPLHLTRFHGCGLGAYLSEEASIATLTIRLTSLIQGESGVSIELIEQLMAFINHRIAPIIPEEGSVGASGDLTPLSYVAATLIGEREVTYQGKKQTAMEVLKKIERKPIKLKPKEGLAIMNGTSVMTALACFAFSRAEYLTKLTSRLTALSSIVLKGNSNHFDESLFAVKPHQGQMKVAEWVRQDLHHEEYPRNSHRLQDRYSIRCAPHVIGVLADALPWMRDNIENEINSANDNPIIDGIGKRVLHGGHFYGGHIAFVMDSMKNCVANLADLMDRQMALLTDPKFNNGLPDNLTGSSGNRLMINHGFKAVQIGMSAWTAEALKLTMPASVFSRSTECHNQDKVSMGTIASRDCLRVLTLTEQVAAAQILAVCQGLEIRIKKGEVDLKQLNPELIQFQEDVFSWFDFVEDDRPLENDLRVTAQKFRIRSGHCMSNTESVFK